MTKHENLKSEKILALVHIFGGVGTFLGIIASITDVFLKHREELLWISSFVGNAR